MIFTLCQRLCCLSLEKCIKKFEKIVFNLGLYNLLPRNLDQIMIVSLYRLSLHDILPD